MEIVKLEKKNNNGELEVTYALSEQQTQVLLEFAINMLVSKGLVSFVEEQVQAKPQSPDEVISVEQAMSEVMEQSDPKDLPQA